MAPPNSSQYLNMFNLAVFKDVVRIAPHNFKKARSVCIADELNHKYANKVVHNVGLCIALFDVLRVGDEFIFPGDGGAHVQVEFRFIVFRPFISEVLTGTIKSSSQKGIHVSMGFFDDIIIPPEHFKRDTRFDAKEQVWVWQVQDADEAYLDLHQEIRFRVAAETFVDITPHTVSPNGPAIAEDESTRQSPFTITVGVRPLRSPQGSIDDDGLGLTAWWKS
eukprot:m.41308 g.41308  ORF g.41308 m.41308 type:complete len:221 (-) comp5662_c0_seq2:609-1271(-)